MIDLVIVGIVLACLAATLALIRACEWLGPRGNQPRSVADIPRPTSEVRP